MTDSFFQHIVFFLLTLSSTGYIFGFTLLEQNLLMPKFTFTIACVGFAAFGLVFHFKILDFVLQKLSIKYTLWLAILIQQLGLICAQFPHIPALCYIAAILTSCGCCALYSALFQLYGNFKHFGVISAVAFAASTMLFYLSVFSQYALISIQILQILSMLLFRPNYPKEMWPQKKLRFFHRSQILSLAVFGSIFSKNLMTVSYFNVSTDQLVFALGLACSVFSGLLLFNLRVGMLVFGAFAVISCVLSAFNNIPCIYLGFYLANLASGGFISGAMAFNSSENVMRDNACVYLALILGNISGFLKDMGRTGYRVCYGVCCGIIVIGLIGLFLAEKPQNDIESGLEKVEKVSEIEEENERVQIANQ